MMLCWPHPYKHMFSNIISAHEWYKLKKAHCLKIYYSFWCNQNFLQALKVKGIELCQQVLSL